MTERIFRAVCLAALAVLLSATALFMGALYRYFSGVQEDELMRQTALAAQAVAHEGAEYFEGLAEDGFRITWIAPDGKVLHDSRTPTGEMENHLERAEVRDALTNGSGESIRYSSTLMERALYAARRLPDGSVIRLSVSHSTVLMLLIGMSQPLAAIVALAVILSLVLAFRLSRQIVSPLNELNLDEPLKNPLYDEISPLLRRIDAQQRQIRHQGEELSRRQSEFETVTRGMAEGIVLLNAKMAVIAINSAASRLFGTDGSCVGKPFQSLSRSLEVQDALSDAAAGLHAETRLDLAGGTYQLTASPVRPEGIVSGIVILLLDVTEKEGAERMRREFTANVSHELKTPLQSIAGSAELLAGGMVKDDDLAGFYARIHGEAMRMVSLVDDIIRLSHLDEGAADMRREECDLLALAREAVRPLEQAAKAGGITLTVCGDGATVTGIPQLLTSIVYNLCDNAIKYNRRDGSVTVTVEQRDGAAVLSVSDTGIGIPVEHRERIFERFYRVDKSRSKEMGGTGLGLSIVKHAARLHRATVTLQSASGGGSTFTVRFPRG